MPEVEKNLNPIDIGEAAKKLTSSISEPIESLFKVGGYVLVFVFVGLVLMLTGYFTGDYVYSPYLFVIGAGIEIICFVGILAAKMYAQSKTNALLRENEDLIRTVLELASKLTENLYNLQSLLYKNAESVAVILETTEPFLNQIPVLRKIDFSQGKNVNEVIFNTADTILEVVNDTRTAISDAKVDPLKKYVEKLENLKQNLREALRSEKTNANTINYKQTLESYRNAILEYSTIVEIVTSDSLGYIKDVDNILSIAKIVPGIGSKLKPIKEKSSNIKLIAIELNETTKTLNTTLVSGNFNDIREVLDSFKGLSKSVKLLKSKPLEIVDEED